MKTSQELLKALSDKTRFKIIQILLTHNYCVGALASRIGISKAAVSQQLQILRKIGLVTGEKRGYWTHYTVRKEVIAKLASDLKALIDQPVSAKTFCQLSFVEENNHNHCREEETSMCNSCECPEKPKKQPEKCDSKQIEECHGDSSEHPCETKES